MGEGPNPLATDCRGRLNGKGESQCEWEWERRMRKQEWAD